MTDLKELRREIDAMDEQIVGLIADRVKVCEAIGTAKKAQGLPIKDIAREERSLQTHHRTSRQIGSRSQ